MKKDYRDAANGRYVTANFAKKHPKTTVGEAKRLREVLDVTKAKTK